jgi:hypothetical protein
MDQIQQYRKTIPQRTVQNSSIGNTEIRMPSRNLFNARDLMVGSKRPMPVLRVKVPLTEVDYGECYYDEEEEVMDYEEMEPLMSVRPRVAAVSRPHTSARPAVISRSSQQTRPSGSQSSSNFPRMRQDWSDLQKTRFVVQQSACVMIEIIQHLSLFLSTKLTLRCSLKIRLGLNFTKD